MTSADLINEVVPALFAGSMRRPLPIGYDALALLSLAGQALRFERPAAPASFAVEPEIKDERTILPSPLRRPMVRLLVSSKATENVARAIARAFQQNRMRPHPFDLPHVENFVRLYAEQLGPAAQHWADRQKQAPDAPGYFEEAALQDSNWTHGSVTRRVTFLEERRRADAATARALLEAVWAQEAADARLRFLQVFETGLSVDDQPFLASLEKDRAPRVRSLAARFLARLGAAGGERPALQACLERIKRSQTGLFRKRTVLQLEVPSNLREYAAARWVRETFSEVSFAELATALELGEEQLLDAAAAAAKQPELLLGFALLATSERRLDLLEKVASTLTDLWERLFESGLDDLGRLTVEERQRWIEVLAKSYGKNLPPNYMHWDWLHRVADCTVPPSVIATALQSGLLEQALQAEATAGAWTELFAAVCPGSQRRALRAQLSAITNAPPGSNAFVLLDILEGMESHRTDG